MNDSTACLRHVVLFKFLDATKQSDIKAIEVGFAGLASQLDLIQDFEWGTNNSPEALNHGFTHCFLVTFATEADRDAYLPHPIHQKFVNLLRPHLDKALVVDYWAS